MTQVTTFHKVVIFCSKRIAFHNKNSEIRELLRENPEEWFVEKHNFLTAMHMIEAFLNALKPDKKESVIASIKIMLLMMEKKGRIR
jgi:hypothetical protein